MMLPFKRILCPTDFSQHSIRALQAAVELCRQFKAELLVLNIVEPVPVAQALMTEQPNVPFVPRLDIDHYEKELVKAHGRILDEIVEHEVPEDVKSAHEVQLGKDGREIVTYAGDKDVDLVVISTHGRTGLGRLVAGSVAEHVIRHAPCPVLTLRARPEDDEE
jgi:universal stress protein A